MNSSKQTKIVLLLALFFLIIQKVAFTQEYKNNEVDDSLLNKVIRIKDNDITSVGTLNTFFATKISTYLSEATDISLSRAYAILDSKDDRLFIGGTYNPKKKLNDFSRLFYTAGFKANIKKGFSEIFNKDGFNNDIGINAKVIIQRKGTVDYTNLSEKDREKLIIKRSIMADKLLTELDDELTKAKKTFKDESEKNEFIKDKVEEMEDKFSEEESKFMIKNKLYSYLEKWWYTIDVYRGLTKSKYNVADSIKSSKFSPNEYRPLEFNGTATYLREKVLGSKKKHLITFWGTLNFAVIKNDSVKAELVEPIPYGKYINQGQTTDSLYLANVQTKPVYIANTNPFATYKFGGRLVLMWDNLIGISASLEGVFGQIKGYNWKLGIPVSLKNKEGEGKINFELIWREVMKKHSVGLSIGLPIGGSIF